MKPTGLTHPQHPHAPGGVTTICAVRVSDAVDEAIRGYLAEPTDESASALAATGENGLRRLLDVWYGREAEPFGNPISDVPDREAIDRWGSAIAITAVCAPSAFVDAVADLDASTLLLAILGDVDDPRASEILCRHLDDEDWLSRYNAVASLGRRIDEAARSGIERALADSNLVVRSAAIDAVRHADPERAIALYVDLLTAQGLTPTLRSRARAAITMLRAGPA